MTTTNHNLMLRQGDVLIVAVDLLPEGLTEIPRKARGLVLADGKATGHAHAIASAAAKLFTDAESVRYLRAVEPVDLLHEEHKTVTIPAGDYRVTIHAEYVPGELPRTVED